MGIDAKRTALLVIDVLEGGDHDAVYDHAIESFENSCVAVVDACRVVGIQVIFCNDAHRSGTDRELALWGDHGIAGSPEARTASALGACESDITIPKRRYDAFFQTDLDLTLRELGVDTVIAIGCDTNICVLQTLAGAFFRNYGSIVVEEAMRTFLVGTQEEGIEYFKRCYGTRVLDLEGFLRSIAE
ncbi:MAG: cysteine hydrolase [Atopobiaceae bacterium]|nr:cysteine hydrolase [Atopobiaceae bacterium]MCI2173214.1 cysteine hydrolase [Atopobiaceae bacterium]